MKLQPNEIELLGKWVVVDGDITADDTSKRIDWLVSNVLEQISVDQSGWDVLYRDPEDGRIWELTYPSSDMHGGGPPRLACVDRQYAQQKYSI